MEAGGEAGGAPGATAPTLGALARAFFLIGATSFGGGLTAFLHRELVRKRRWLDEEEFLRGYSVAQAVPGPNAINLAIYFGWAARGARGALVATTAVLAAPLAAVSLLAAAWTAWPAASLAPVLRALAAFGVGLMAATFASLFRAARLRAPDLALAATAFVAVGILRWSVPAVLASLAAVSLLVPRAGTGGNGA